MNTKTVAGIIIVVIVVIAVAAVALSLGGGDDDDRDGGIEVTTGVNYHGNGGQTSDGSQVYGLTSETVTPNTFQREGMVFTGWNTRPDGTGTAYSVNGTIHYGNGTVDLYAQWAYAFTVSNVSSSGSQVFTPVVYLVYDDGSREIVTSLGAPLPDDGMGRMEVRISGLSNWVVDSEFNNIVGTDASGNEYVVTATMVGPSDIIACVDETSGYGGFLFAFEEGPVSCELSISQAI